MLNLLKPGHILRFATCPGTILSPHGSGAEANDNRLETAWPGTSNLGLVQCLSHPGGNIGPIAAAVATGLRTTPASVGRSVGYSAVGRALTASNRVVGSLVCDFVGYVDGQSNYIQSTQTVFSKDFSGCLMAVYTVDGVRRVAHVAASQVPQMNCKQAFLDTLQGMDAVMNGWFRPYVDANDFNRKVQAFAVVGGYITNQIDKLTTFGVVTAAGQAYAVDAFKPTGIPGNDWVVTYVGQIPMSYGWVAP